MVPSSEAPTFFNNAHTMIMIMIMIMYHNIIMRNVILVGHGLAIGKKN